MSYTHIIDYLGDLRATERLECPPGGSAGCNVSDAYLCVIAEKARRQTDPLEYLRNISITLYSQAAPGNWQNSAFCRVADWTAEFRRVAA